MTHPLGGAYHRRGRATQHLDELKDEVEKLRKRLPASIGARVPTSEIPPLLSILIGEIAYNLGAALDYLAYELWWHDDKTDPGNQSAFGRPSGREKVSPKHKLMFEEY